MVTCFSLKLGMTNVFSLCFLENAMSFEGYFKYIAIFVSLGALLVVTSLYLRHRLQTKYRDLSIIFLY